MLEQAAERLAAQNTAELVKLILSPEPGVAHEAIRRAGALKSPRGGHAAHEGARGRRLGASRGARCRRWARSARPARCRRSSAAWRTPSATCASPRCVRCRTRSYRAGAAELEAIVKGKAIRDADLTEKMAVFEAYGALCGDDGVAALDAMLNGKSLFGRREDAELRACAAVALGRVGTPKAQEALRRPATEKDVVVRNAVNRALRGGTA